MFIAKKQDGNYFSLLDFQGKEGLSELQLNEPFFCPTCNGLVKLKRGLKRRVHFAHVTAECSSSTEPESMYHLEGKAKIYKSLQHFDEANLEYFIPQSRQRADIYMRNGKTQFAFEFQCSPIDSLSFMRRTKLYEQSALKPIWIIGKDKLPSINSYMKFSPFHWMFLQKNTPGSPPYILSFCPHKSLFYYFFPSFSFNSSRTYLTYYTSDKWLHHPHSPATTINSWKESWLHYKKKWRYEYCLYKGNRSLRSFCYSKFGIPLSFFPSEIGIPVPSFFWFQTSIIEWQAWLYFDSIYHTPASSIIHVPSVLKRFELRIKQSHIKLKQLPLVIYGNYQDAVVEYFNQLVILGVLELESPLIYRKKQKEKPLSSIEEAAGRDRQKLEQVLRK